MSVQQIPVLTLKQRCQGLAGLRGLSYCYYIGQRGNFGAGNSSEPGERTWLLSEIKQSGHYYRFYC